MRKAVDALWSPGGFLDPLEARVTGSPTFGQGADGVWRVTGPGTLGRRIPTKHVNVPASSQFFAKADAHEQEHINHWATGHPLFGGHHQPSAFFDRIRNLTDSTQTGLFNQVVAELEIFSRQQDMIFAQGLSQTEILAFQVSDLIPPRYIYQNCGRYQ